MAREGRAWQEADGEVLPLQLPVQAVGPPAAAFVARTVRMVVRDKRRRHARKRAPPLKLLRRPRPCDSEGCEDDSNAHTWSGGDDSDQNGGEEGCWRALRRRSQLFAALLSQQWLSVEPCCS